ncbi:ATP-grasp domain-containing protein [Streptomyces sp. Je 1-4]|uniref:ATP-grasp domain-containing protein n=1 Tax=Streptomyces TaxID=1883 RepID=UPI0021DA0C73|nr:MULTISPECIES: ATP-grasp domain-containing protein [unclassified Streptomyces]UYB38605.1 ATP-grasp domain-containing protein [Streptomyces sp. Je 1-4]UZQ34573.1 ATP-grasp domain-containing protein [Streptomyces sp. Je 1-4] [Streptomyces sp. Je 1-4 4N24]UZQ41991.1 ATP-grasp domain-containing protein [Streptomyces sp. Je 1-4] [Streptomyces sp. Je 1-4 4N24_ara]
MALLLLNRRPLLPLLPAWLPGASLIVLTARSVVGLPSSLPLPRERFARFETVDDYESPEVDDLIDRICADGGVERVVTTAEIDVVRAARARERHGLPGQSTASALAYRDKHRMKALAARHGVAVSPMAPVRDTGDLRSFAAAHGLPVVVKPADGAGSVGVRVLRDARAVRGCALSADRAWLAERYVEGDVCHVDGLMAKGAVLHGLASRYLHTNLDTATEGVPSVSGMLAAADPLAGRLVAAAARVVAALPAVEEVTAFHAEFFHTPQDALVLCEIACRPGGCGIAEAYALSTGVGLYEAHVRGQAGLSPDVPDPGRGYPRHGWGWFPPRRGTLVRLPAHCPLPRARGYVTSGEPGRRYEGPRSSTDSVAELLFRVDDAEALTPQLREVDDWWSREVRWAAP